MAERIILGIDPGTNVLGYGVLKVCDGRRVEVIAMGVIDLRRCADVYLKLGRIYERVMGIIDAFLPNELAIEAPFFGKNVQSMLKLGRAQGVTIAAAISRQIPISEYAPLKVKQAITGNGAASKEQVAEMVKRVLHVDASNMDFLDATDALAVAYCHYLQQTPRGVSLSAKAAKTKSTSSSWADFAKQHSDRIHSRKKTISD